MRDRLMHDAGGLSYDLIHTEFRQVARRLGWPASATLKDFRHLFATSLANGGMPDHERRHLLGHAPGRDAVHVYTHMTRLADHYRAAIEYELARVLEVVRSRTAA